MVKRVALSQVYATRPVVRQTGGNSTYLTVILSFAVQMQFVSISFAVFRQLALAA